jgi:hypothetical protein
MRTLEEMKEIIRGGQSVFGNDGKLYTKLEELPSEAELAKGNEEAEELARESINAQIEALKQQLTILEPEDKPAKTEKTEKAVEKTEKVEETDKTVKNK